MVHVPSSSSDAHSSVALHPRKTSLSLPSTYPSTFFGTVRRPVLRLLLFERLLTPQTVIHSLLPSPRWTPIAHVPRTRPRKVVNASLIVYFVIILEENCEEYLGCYNIIPIIRQVYRFVTSHASTLAPSIPEHRLPAFLDPSTIVCAVFRPIVSELSGIFGSLSNKVTDIIIRARVFARIIR